MRVPQAIIAPIGLGLGILGICVFFVFGRPFRTAKDLVSHTPFRIEGGLRPRRSNLEKTAYGRIAAQERRDRPHQRVRPVVGG